MTQIRTKMWVQALLRRAEIAGAMGAVIKAGDIDAGVVLLQVSYLDGRADFYAPATDMDGQRIWTRPLGSEPVDEALIRAYCQRRLADDRDLWLVEIEDRAGRNFLTEPVEK